MLAQDKYSTRNPLNVTTIVWARRQTKLCVAWASS